MIAKKVSGIANFKPQCSGMIEPKKIPIMYSHVVHKVTPANKMIMQIFSSLFNLKKLFETANVWSVIKYEIKSF